LSGDRHWIDTNVLGRSVVLPADWSGKAPNAERCAIHGLILAAKMQHLEVSGDRVAATLPAGDFGGHWLSAALIHIEVILRADSLTVNVTVSNTGDEKLPVGIGWHPYFAIPSKRRDQVRVHLPARKRALVNNYDDVFPTVVIEPVTGTPYDFTAPEGAPLGSRYYDDSFVDLEQSAGGATRVEIRDPAARYGIRLTASSPHIRALQLYSRPDQPFVVVEPQFNWSDPFSPVCPPNVDTGMVILQPGAETTWSVEWHLRCLEETHAS
jgi:galactose mutarotase-like enzyme